MLGLSLFEKMLSPANLEVNPGQCLKLRHKKSSCRLCLENCPTGAISFGDSLEINNSKCYGCGICANLCPTDVFQLRDLSYELLLAQVKRGSVVEFTCSLSSSNKDGLNVPCLGYLNEAILTGAIVGGSQAVRLNITQCKKCRFALGLRVAAKSMKRANRILAIFGLPRRISASVKESGDSHNLTESQVCSRREFFAYFQGETRSRVAVAVEGMNSDEEMAAKTKVTLETRLPKKRSLLLEHIKKLGQPVTDQARLDDLPFAQVDIGDGCDGCGMCVTFCPTGALKSREEGDRQVIDFNPGYCLACGLCIDICPQGAIAYSAGVNPWDLVSGGRTILVKHRKAACTQCEQTYIAVTGSRLCLNCRKKKEAEEWLVKMWRQS